MSDHKANASAMSSPGSGPDFPQLAQSLAESWIAAWNSHDLERVLALFTDDVVFTSPKAVAIMGRDTVTGKAELRAYWTVGLARAQGLRFRLRELIADAERRSLAIVYDAEVNGQPYQAVELLHLHASGRFCRGHAMYSKA
jgi:uncharacterized protein (TIGR02246 family)